MVSVFVLSVVDRGLKVVLNKSLKIVEARHYNIDNHEFYSEVVNQRRTTDTIVKRKITKRQTMVTKTLTRKRQIGQQIHVVPLKPVMISDFPE
jgi:predicted naringenin-chalcone synthase